jgi:hypothetical protein
MTSSFKGLIVNDTSHLKLPNGTYSDRPSLYSNSAVQWTNTGTQAYSVIAGSATATNTSWTCPTGVTSIEVLVVAGGGGGGSDLGGGGGGGGLIYNSSYPVTPGTTYSVSVGAGGAGGGTTRQSNSQGTNGSNSQFDILTAIGGGGGGAYWTSNSTYDTGKSGGSGGGNGAKDSTFGPRSTATAGQGWPGGLQGWASSYSGGGGGGAGGPGGDAGPGTTYSPGPGGPGLQFSISGTPTFYAGGGGGSNYHASNGNTAGGLGGVGGGGNGGYNITSPQRDGQAGTASTGGGGGAGSWTGSNPANGGAGGSGIVIIRYTLADATSQPQGQVRVNTVSGVLETFETKNLWTPTRTSENIVTNGLVLHLDASRYTSGTTWKDLSPLGNDGVLTNSPVWSTDGGGAFSFNGSNQYVTMGSPVPASLQMTTSVTLSAWINTSTLTSNNLYEIVGCQYDTGTYKGCTIFIDTRTTPYTIHFQMGNTAGWAAANDSTCQEVPQNVWIHVAATWTNGQKGKVYINGFYNNGNDTSVFYGPLTYSPSGQEYSVGRQSDIARYFLGKIAVVQVYNRALTGAEIVQNYNALAPRFNKAQKPNLGLTTDTPATSAQAIKNAWPGAPSGLYWLQPSTWSAPALIYCEMQLHGGGWIYMYQKSCTDDVGLYLSEFQSNSGTPNHATANFYGCVDRWGKTYTGQDMWNAFIGSSGTARMYCREVQYTAGSNQGYDESQSYTDANNGPIISWSDFVRFMADNLSNGTWRTGIQVRYNNGASVRSGMTATTWSAPSLSTINNGSVDQNMYFCNGQTGGDNNWSFALMKGGTPYPRLADSYNGGNRHAGVNRWAILAFKA